MQIVIAKNNIIMSKHLKFLLVGALMVLFGILFIFSKINIISSIILIVGLLIEAHAIFQLKNNSLLSSKKNYKNAI